MKDLKINNMRCLVTFCILFLIAVNVTAQSSDVLFDMFLAIREFEKKILMSYRFDSNLVFNNRRNLLQEYYRLPFDSPSKYKGIDMSYIGIYADVDIQNRIIQLLRGDFYDGELDSLVNCKMKFWRGNDSIKQIVYDKVRQEIKGKSFIRQDLILGCMFIENREIYQLLAAMYEDKHCDEGLKDSILKYLLYRRIEPYTSRCIKNSVYNRDKSYKESETCINNLLLIKTQESYRLLADYLLSSKYKEIEICYDCNIPRTINEIEKKKSQNIVAETYKTQDTTSVEILDLDLDEDVFSGPFGYTEKEYISSFVLANILRNIKNQELLQIVGLKRGNNGGLVPDNDNQSENPTNIEKVYNWMKKNYGKYEFINRW